MTRLSPLYFAALLCLATTFISGCAPKKPEVVGPERFKSPYHAARTLVAATRDRDTERLKQIFGPEIARFGSGNPQQDDADIQRLAAAMARHWEIVDSDTDPLTNFLIVGRRGWVFPAPLVFAGGGWTFDTAAGIEEVTNRRIGRNELDAINTCRWYVQAQRDYFEMDPDHDGVKQFAGKIRSDEGKCNGLYWSDEAADANNWPQSPGGPLLAGARAGGHLVEEAGGRRSYRGYYYKALAGQGDGAAVVPFEDESGHVTRGFALLAWPARYGETGVMSFQVSADGVVYERNLGPQTDSTATNTDAFNTAGWRRARD